MNWGEDVVLAGARSMVLRSEHLDDDLKVTVALPFGPEPVEGVLVVLDPTALFLTAVETSRTLSRLARTSFRIAVVGVGVPVDAQYMDKRARDFTPVVDRDVEQSGESPTALGTGRGERFLAALTEEVMPRVADVVAYDDETPSAIAGWSLSGLFALWAWNASPDVFSGAIAVSPSLWWADGHMLTLPIEAGADRRVYACVGEHEEGQDVPVWPVPPPDPERHQRARMVSNLATWSAHAEAAGVTITSEILADVHHADSGQIGIARGIRVLFGDDPVPAH